MLAFSTNLLFFLAAVLGGAMISLWGPIALLAIPIAGYFARMIMSRQMHGLVALGLTIGVAPLWGMIIFLTSDYTASIVWLIHIILVPILWLVGAWVNVRWHKQIKSFISS